MTLWGGRTVNVRRLLTSGNAAIFFLYRPIPMSEFMNHDARETSRKIIQFCHSLHHVRPFIDGWSYFGCIFLEREITKSHHVVLDLGDCIYPRTTNTNTMRVSVCMISAFISPGSLALYFRLGSMQLSPQWVVWINVVYRIPFPCLIATNQQCFGVKGCEAPRR